MQPAAHITAGQGRQHSEAAPIAGAGEVSPSAVDGSGSGRASACSNGAAPADRVSFDGLDDGAEEKGHEGAEEDGARFKTSAKRPGHGTILVPLLSAGPEFKYPPNEAAQTALQRALEFLQSHPHTDLRIVFVEPKVWQRGTSRCGWGLVHLFILVHCA